MPNITLTAEQVKKVVFSSCYYYASFNNPIDINTAHSIALEAGKVDFFDGIVLALAITYPIPIEPIPPVTP